MVWFPVKQETLVLPYGLPEAEARLQMALEPPDDNWGLPYPSQPQAPFTGRISGPNFRISRSIRRPESFLPLLKGHLEATRHGSLLFIRYQLFPSTLGYLLFWTVVSLGLAVLFFGSAQNYLYGSIAGLLAGAQYLIALKNFLLQVKRSRQALQQVFFE